MPTRFRRGFDTMLNSKNERNVELKLCVYVTTQVIYLY